MINLNSIFSRSSLGLITLLLTGCAFQPNSYNTTVELPANFLVQNDSIQLVQQPERLWWSQFGKEELVTLIAEMTTNNRSLITANFRIEQSKALLGVQRANNWPSVNGTLDIGRHSAISTTPNYENASFTATYEVDLSGFRDAANKSVQYQVQFQHENMRGALLSLQTLLSQQYFDVLALKARLKLTKQNLTATEKLYQLIKTKVELGSGNQIELDQQRNVLIEQEKQYKGLTRDIEIAKRGIAVLLGRENIEDLQLNGSIGSVTFPQISITQPAKILEFRPDIKLAELNLKISDTELYAAKAKRWPNLTLSLESSFLDVFNAGSTNTSLLGSLTAPIFQAGRISNQIAAAEVATNIELVKYRETVVNALQETQDSLTTYHFQKSIYDLQSSSVKNNESLYQQAKLMYETGASDFLNLLIAQKSLFQARDSLVQHEVILLNSMVNIFKAMGAPPSTNKELRL